MNTPENTSSPVIKVSPEEKLITFTVGDKSESTPLEFPWGPKVSLLEMLLSVNGHKPTVEIV